MLVVKVEIWPDGDISARHEIARLGIINRGGTSGIADYDVIGVLGRDRQEWVTHGLVLGHVRSLGWKPLVARALTEQDDGLLHPEYVQSEAAHLRKG